MLDFIKKNQRLIGALFIAVAFILFTDKAMDLGAEAVPMLGEIMLGIILFAVGYAFVVHAGQRKKPEADEPEE